MRYELEKKDCERIMSIYRKVAEFMGLEEKDCLQFFPTKIRCTEAVRREVFDAFECDEVTASMLWADVGPKADLEGEGYAVEIEDGFVFTAQQKKEVRDKVMDWLQTLAQSQGMYGRMLDAIHKAEADPDSDADKFWYEMYAKKFEDIVDFTMKMEAGI